MDRQSSVLIRDCSIALEGVVESFSEQVGGYGFLRPAENAELWQQRGCSGGVYIARSQMRRYGLYEGQRVWGHILPPEPPEHKSPRLADILPDDDADVWRLLEQEVPETGPPPRLRHLVGVRLHGTVTKVDSSKRGAYGDWA